MQTLFLSTQASLGTLAYMFQSPCSVTLHVLDTVMVGPSIPTPLIVPLCMDAPPPEILGLILLDTGHWVHVLTHILSL